MKVGRALGIVALMALASESQAGAIRGHLRLGATPRQFSMAGTSVAPVGVDQAVVWLDPLPPSIAGRYRAVPRRARVTQSNRRFAPLVTLVMVGSTVDFANRDKVYHNVFSVSPAQRFDLGKYPPRASQQVTFERPGVVNLFCDIHPWMAAHVVVLPNRAYARPNRAGDFRLPVLPPGRYTLHVWHPTQGERRTEVDVPHRGDATVAVSF